MAYIRNLFHVVVIVFLVNSPAGCTWLLHREFVFTKEGYLIAMALAFTCGLTIALTYINEQFVKK